jgi:hypothetical protein
MLFSFEFARKAGFLLCFAKAAKETSLLSSLPVDAHGMPEWVCSKEPGGASDFLRFFCVGSFGGKQFQMEPRDDR